MKEPALDRKKRSGRPFLVERLLLLGYAIFSVNGWLRLIGSITQWNWLAEANVRPGPLYLLLSGLVWGTAALIAIGWIIWRLPYYRLVGLAVALLIAVFYWIDRLLVRNPAANLPNTAFALTFTIMAIVYVLFALRFDSDLERFLAQSAYRKE